MDVTTSETEASPGQGGQRPQLGAPGSDESTTRGPRGDRREAARPWLLVAPALVVISVLFGGAIVLATQQSLGYVPLAGQTELTFDAYRQLFARSEFWPSLWLTLYIGVVSTGIAIFFGVGFALLLRRVSRRFRFLTFLFQLNLPVPHVVSATAILLLLSQSGTASRIASQVALIDSPSDFPLLVFDPWAFGIIASFSWKEVPFITVIALAQLQSTVTNYEDVATMLGAGAWQRLRHVTLPIVLPGVLVASVLVFAFTFGSYEVPLLLGQSFPATLPVLAVQLHNDVNLSVRPQGMAISVVVTLITVILVAAYMKLARSTIRQEGR